MSNPGKQDQIEIAHDSHNEEAEVAQVGPTKVMVDADNSNIEVPSSKKVQVSQGTDKKIKVMKFVAFAHKKILNHFFEAPDPSDLSVGDQVHNILFTCYTLLRQHYNETGGTSEVRTAGTEFKIIHEGVHTSKPRDAVIKIVRDEAETQGIPFGQFQQGDPNNWYSVVNPVMNFLAGFAVRRKELRLGHHVMPIKKRDNEEKEVLLYQYGIFRLHHPLCQGVTFPPEKRVSMAQTVDPLTALLCYIKSERMYSKKWADAVKRHFAHFPDIDAL